MQMAVSACDQNTTTAALEWRCSGIGESRQLKYLLNDLVEDEAIILHFVIGYEHPFHDGNGRVARSLFYWYLFKCGFGGFRYLAISRLLKIAPVKYGKSYLYTETDDIDLTYFIDYQCQVIARTIQEFTRNHEAAVAEIDCFNALLYESGLYAKLSDKQRILFNAANSSGITSFTVTDVKNKLGCAYNTAATVLNGLVDLQLFHKVKTGREWVYSMIDTTLTVKSRP
ncbi:Filamentation induced by cAMP protein fic [Pseudomonas syringae pv. ribicola]|uniref:Filamentation induced by cAMP protein fic n=1 Tax=Pseudomonas syringae pv. ribicola TaxID=55398 RepID=A0A3M2W5S2_PSESI|nr:Filamentation induced by cAMP protein fic [Pseudomonas syringae pv. ribicola]